MTETILVAESVRASHALLDGTDGELALIGEVLRRAAREGDARLLIGLAETAFGLLADLPTREGPRAGSLPPPSSLTPSAPTWTSCRQPRPRSRPPSYCCTETGTWRPRTACYCRRRKLPATGAPRGSAPKRPSGSSSWCVGSAAARSTGNHSTVSSARLARGLPRACA